MKKILSLLLILSALIIAWPAKAQVNDGITAPMATNSFFKALDWLTQNQDVLTTNKNWTFIPYLSHAKGLVDSTGQKAEWGGGIAALYPINDYVRAGFRLQYFKANENWFMPSATVQLSPSYHLFGIEKLIWTPATWVGLATPIGGSAENGNIAAIYGAGLSVKYRIKENIEAGLGYGIEDWSNLKVDYVTHYAVVISVRF